MKFFVSLLLLPTFVIFMAPSANAARVENDGKYLYYVTPWTDAFRDKEQTKFLFNTGIAVVRDYLKSLVASGALPETIGSNDDLESFAAANEKIDLMIEKLNQSINQMRSHSSLSAADAVPTALIAYAGTKLTVDLKIGAGGALAFGLVIMPVRVQKVDKFSNEIVGSPELEWRFAPVFWLAPEIGTKTAVDIKVLPKARLGGGLIWSRTMSDPGQFLGYGASVTRTYSMGPAGINLKVGFVNNSNLKDYLDTVYAIAGYESGPAIGQNWSVNGAAIYPLSKIIDLLNPDADGSKTSPVSVQAFQEKFNKILQQKTLEKQSNQPGSAPMPPADDIPPVAPKN